MLFMLLQAFVCTNAQPFKTQAAAQDYFATHISELDPIEVGCSKSASDTRQIF